MRMLLLLLATAPLLADSPAPNTPTMATSRDGRCYAKSVPTEYFGNAGETQVFRVMASEDELVQTYDWYSFTIELACNVSDGEGPTAIAVVSFGPWANGFEASDDVLAMAFHYNGKTVREYSTLDIAGTKDNVSRSVSHYTVIEKVLGFRELGGNEYVFEVRTTDGRTLGFNPATGERLD